MRTFAFLVVLAELIFLGPLYLMYGQVDPCRALAAEMASREEPPGMVGDLLNGDPEISARREIAEQSTSQCTGAIVQSWMDRVGG